MSVVSHMAFNAILGLFFFVGIVVIRFFLEFYKISKEECIKVIKFLLALLICMAVPAIYAFLTYTGE